MVILDVEEKREYPKTELIKNDRITRKHAYLSCTTVLVCFLLITGADQSWKQPG